MLSVFFPDGENGDIQLVRGMNVTDVVATVVWSDEREWYEIHFPGIANLTDYYDVHDALVAATQIVQLNELREMGVITQETAEHLIAAVR